MNNELYFMERCFQLAEQGRGYTRSNPLVGAVLVHENKILSEGYHAQYGGAHAEVNCLKNIENMDILRESTLYVSLEPCNYHGKTPPCVDFILKKGIQKVVVGSEDFNPRVKFQGIDYLRSQEINVINLNLVEKQKQLNISFFINQTLNEPYFIGKIAFSRDKMIGCLGEKIKITTSEVDAMSHKIRAGVDAILVGKNTWLNDSPTLNARLYYSDYQPDIIVLSNQNLNISTKTIDGRKIHQINQYTSENDLKNQIFQLGYRNILVEGGRGVFHYFEKNQLFHEIITIENKNLDLNSREGIKVPEINSQHYIELTRDTYLNQEIKKYQRRDIFNTEYSLFF